MERGFEQLFVLVAIVLAALFDLLLRWLRKTPKDQPADVTDVADSADVAELDEELVLVEKDDAERPTPPPTEPSTQPAAQRPTQPPTAVRPRRRHRARSWLMHPDGARRGIVLMAVLGPCRGLEAPDRNV